MGMIAKDLPALFMLLLPGFISAGVFYTLTAHPKTSEFERVIQALIFTAILKALTIVSRAALLVAGRLISVGIWNGDVELVYSVALALPLGVLFAYGANRDRFHRVLRSFNITRRTSHPSEWYSAFAREQRYVILHLNDGRRLYGWPDEWPDQPDKGHFLLSLAEWLLEDNERAPLHHVALFMIPATDVKMVEFMKRNQEILETSIEVQRAESLLLSVQKEATGGSEATSASAGPRSEDPSGQLGGAGGNQGV